MAQETALAILGSATTRQLPPAILITGPQVFLRECVYDALRRRLCTGSVEYRGFQVGAGDDFGAVINELLAPGLFAKAAVVGCRVLRSRRERSGAEEGTAEGAESAAPASGADEGALVAAVEELGGPGSLLLLYEKDTPPAKVRRAFERSGLTVVCNKPYDNQLGQYVAALARMLGLKLTARAVEFLVGRHGANLAGAFDALQRAAISADAIRPLDLDALQEPGGQRSPELFELAESLAAADVPRSIALFDRALAVGRDPFELLAVEVIPVLRRMMVAAALLDRNQSSVVIAGELGLSPTSPLAGRAIEGARRLGGVRLARAYRAASELDASLKMGLTKGREQAIAALILELLVGTGSAAARAAATS